MIVRKKLAELRPDPTQPRHVFKQDELQNLAQNIQAHGQIDPIRCFERDGVLVILDGERRYRAMTMLGFIEADVRIVEEPPTRKLSLLQASIDLHRENFNSIERATLFERIIRENGWSANETAKQLGICQSTISEHLQLLRLAPAIQEAVAKGQIAVSKGVVIAREPDHGKQLELANAYATLTRQELKQRLNESVGNETKPKRASFAMPNGTVAMQFVGKTVADAIELLQATVKELKRGQSDDLDLATIQIVMKQRVGTST